MSLPWRIMRAHEAMLMAWLATQRSTIRRESPQQYWQTARRQYSSPTPTTVRTTTDFLEMNGHSCCNMPARPSLMPTVSNNYTYIHTLSLRLFSFRLPPSFSRLRRAHSENWLPSRIQGCKCLHTCRLLWTGGSGRHWHIRRPQESLRYSPPSVDSHAMSSALQDIRIYVLARRESWCPWWMRGMLKSLKRHVSQVLRLLPPSCM